MSSYKFPAVRLEVRDSKPYYIPLVVKYQVSVFTDKDSPAPKAEKSNQNKPGPRDRKAQGQGQPGRGQPRNQRPNDGRGRGGGKEKQGMAGSDDTGKSPEADVYITLMGTKGDTGARHLKANQENSNKFQPGKVSLLT